MSASAVAVRTSSPLARDRVLEVVAPLQPLFPDGGLRRGSTVVVSARSPAGGATTLAVALLAGLSDTGGWGAVVGMPGLGVVAAAQLGVGLERLALIPHPEDRWPVAVAALLDGMDAVVLAPPRRRRPRDVQRLSARARERGAVLVVAEQSGDGSWQGRDLFLEVSASTWVGAGDGHGYLRGRWAEVVASGRGAAARARQVGLWLPGPDGAVAGTPDGTIAGTPDGTAAETSDGAVAGTPDGTAAGTPNGSPLRAVGGRGERSVG